MMIDKKWNVEHSDIDPDEIKKFAPSSDPFWFRFMPERGHLGGQSISGRQANIDRLKKRTPPPITLPKMPWDDDAC